jgi:hypothetical protein
MVEKGLMVETACAPIIAVVVLLLGNLRAGRLNSRLVNAERVEGSTEKLNSSRAPDQLT